MTNALTLPKNWLNQFPDDIQRFEDKLQLCFVQPSFLSAFLRHCHKRLQHIQVEPVLFTRNWLLCSSMRRLNLHRFYNIPQIKTAKLDVHDKGETSKAEPAQILILKILY